MSRMDASLWYHLFGCLVFKLQESLIQKHLFSDLKSSDLSRVLSFSPGLLGGTDGQWYQYPAAHPPDNRRI